LKALTQHKRDHKPTRIESTEAQNEGRSPNDGDDPGGSDNDQGDSSSIHSDDSPLLKLGKANEQLVWNERDMWKVITGMKAQSSIPKLPSPSWYNGATDYDRFESWVSQHIQNCLEGKASKWYIIHVAREPHKWNFESITKGLFDWCFPPEFCQVNCRLSHHG